MSPLETTPYARNALGNGLMNAMRDSVPLGYSLSLSGRTPRGPWRVLLLRDGAPIYDEQHADLEIGVGMALASIAPTDLENELAASLRAIG